MNRHFISLTITMLFLSSVYGQTKSLPCNCPVSQYADTIPDTAFYLSNGKIIVLCGYKTPDIKPAFHSEFILAVCGQDTIIDFWGAVLTCRLRTNKDTLFVDELRNLPVGVDYKFEMTVWSTEKIYFNGSNMVRFTEVNRQIRKYDPDEIQSVLTYYDTAMPGLDEGKMEIANKLFIAAISGSVKAREYFHAFPTRFGTLDGAFKEEFSDLYAMLTLWDKFE